MRLPSAPSEDVTKGILPGLAKEKPLHHSEWNSSLRIGSIFPSTQSARIELANILVVSLNANFKNNEHMQINILCWPSQW